MNLFDIISFINEEPGRNGLSQIGWRLEWNREALLLWEGGRGAAYLSLHCFGPAESQPVNLCPLLL